MSFLFRKVKFAEHSSQQGCNLLHNQTEEGSLTGKLSKAVVFVKLKFCQPSLLACGKVAMILFQSWHKKVNYVISKFDNFSQKVTVQISANAFYSAEK